MRFRASGSTSSPKKASATVSAISWNVISGISSKNLLSNVFILSGIYRPLSSANPFTTAFSRVAIGAFLFVL